MPLQRKFASTINRGEPQVQPIGQLPKWLTQGETSNTQPSLLGLAQGVTPISPAPQLGAGITPGDDGQITPVPTDSFESWMAQNQPGIDFGTLDQQTQQDLRDRFAAEQGGVGGGEPGLPRVPGGQQSFMDWLSQTHPNVNFETLDEQTRQDVIDAYTAQYTPPIEPPPIDFDTTTDFVPDITEIPTDVEGLLALFDEDPDTPGVQSQVAELAGMSAEELAAHFKLAGHGESFQAVNLNQLQGLLTDVGEARTFELGQAGEALTLGTTEARRRFGLGAAGIRASLLGLSQQATQARAASGFAGVGAIGATQTGARRAAGRAIGEEAAGFRGRRGALKEAFQGEQFRVQERAEAGVQDLINKIAEQVGGFGETARQLVIGGAEGEAPIYNPDEPGFDDPKFISWMEGMGRDPAEATQEDWDAFVSFVATRGRDKP